MWDGDVAGLAALRDRSATIAVTKAGSTTRVVMTNGIDMHTSWTTTSVGTEVAGAMSWVKSYGCEWRPTCAPTAEEGRPSSATARMVRQCTPLGNTLTMTKDWQSFLGYRFGIFNYVTNALGGSVTVNVFEVAKP